MVDEPKSLQKQAESRHHKTKSHQRQPRAHPSQKRPLRRQVVAQLSFLSDFRSCIHFSCPWSILADASMLASLLPSYLTLPWSTAAVARNCLIAAATSSTCVSSAKCPV